MSRSGCSTCLYVFTKHPVLPRLGLPFLPSPLASYQNQVTAIHLAVSEDSKDACPIFSAYGLVLYVRQALNKSLLKERKKKRKTMPETLCSLKLSARSQAVIFFGRKQSVMPLIPWAKKKALNDGSRIFMGVIEGSRICTILRCILNPVTGMLIIKGSFKDGQTETQRRKTMCR